MRLRQHIPAIAVLLTLALAAVGCSHQELYVGRTGEVTINYRWNTSGKVSKTPGDIKEMTVYFFPEDGSSPHRYVINSNTTGTISVPYGHYKIITYNSDTEVIVPVGGMTYDTFGLRATSTTLLSTMGFKSDNNVPRAAQSADEPVSWEVDPVWAGNALGIDITPGDPDATVNINMEECFSVIDINITGVENLQNATAYSGTVDGMAYAYYPGQGEISTATTTIPFALTADLETKTISAHFLTFGYSTASTHHLGLYFILHNGEKVYYEYDITQALNEAASTGTAVTPEISLDELHLRLPDIMTEDGDSPLNLEVTPWEIVEIPITL